MRGDDRDRIKERERRVGSGVKIVKKERKKRSSGGDGISPFHRIYDHGTTVEKVERK